MKYKDILHFARHLRKNQTPAENLFWQNVRKRKTLGLKFLRQFIIEHKVHMGKSYFYISDFYCHEKKLIIEIDGRIHEQQVAYDQIREQVLKEMGYRILRFKNEEVLKDASEVMQRLREYIRELPDEQPTPNPYP